MVLEKTVTTKRIIGKVEGKLKGPTVVFFAGIHGNEDSGVIALKRVFETITPEIVHGSVYGISGNIKALKSKQRFLDEDLNRMWTRSRLELLNTKSNLNSEEEEQIELFEILEEITKQNSGPFYFIDFHTTSSKTVPFITINDALINRKFSSLFPVPIVLGIEEYLNGPLLSYINELGYVSLGFESGQHGDKEAVSNSISFAYLTMVYAKCLSSANVVGLPVYYNQLKSRGKTLNKIFEVVYMHHVNDHETFQMHPGFKSFQDIKKGSKLALSNGNEIDSKYNAKLFMPLYQKQGNEGFFIIRPIHPFFLKLSEALRKYKMDRFLVALPGIKWDNKERNALIVNLKVTRFFAKSIFHLFGYRNKQVNTTHVKLYNRERGARIKMYTSEDWYK